VNATVSDLTVLDATVSTDLQQRRGTRAATTTAGRFPTAVPARREVEA